MTARRPRPEILRRRSARDDLFGRFCWIGKRNLEAALRSSGVDAVVRWKAYQLNPSASDTPSSKVEMYMRKFGRSREEVLQLSRSMEQKFAAVGLPHSFTEKALVSNTLDGHRVLAWAGAQSPAAQDAAAERLFRGYFAEERAPNDRDLLIEACVAAGKREADAIAFLDDKSAMRDQVQRELQEARGVRGVPHFVIRQPGRDPVQISGAQPPEVFERALQ